PARLQPFHFSVNFLLIQTCCHIRFNKNRYVKNRRKTAHDFELPHLVPDSACIVLTAFTRDAGRRRKARITLGRSGRTGSPVTSCRRSVAADSRTPRLGAANWGGGPCPAHCSNAAFYRGSDEARRYAVDESGRFQIIRRLPFARRRASTDGKCCCG